MDHEEDEIPERFKNQDAATVPCPSCGKSVSEFANRCPHCEDYITPEHSQKMPLWLIVTAIILIMFMVAFWVLM